VRSALFNAARAAIRHPSTMRDFYNRIAHDNKRPGKIALTAVMRKSSSSPTPSPETTSTPNIKPLDSSTVDGRVKPGYDEKSSARNREQGETTAIRAGRELCIRE
jgi:hypothetical protein